jgi:hypothetical protein
MSTAIEGGCLCGAVRYVATTAPVVVRLCWCRLCQYYGTGNATLNLAFARDAVTLRGELADYSSTADSGNHMHRRFCPRCGTQVTSEAEERPHLIVLRAGTLDDPSIVSPQMQIWTSQAPPWAQFDPQLPQFPGQAPPPVLK